MVLVLAALATPILAQPYAASGGFDRARRIAFAGGPPGAAVARDGGAVYVYWDDGTGIWRLPLAAPARVEPSLIVASRTVRRLLAATVDDGVALARIERDPASASWSHYLSWSGEGRLLLNDLRQSPLALAPGPAGPAILLARFEGTDMALELHRWDGITQLVHHSDKDIDGLSLRFDDRGAAHLSWLEGEVRRTEFGNIAQWDAYYAMIGPGGTVSAPVQLGEAGRRGIQFVTRVDLTPAGPTVMWTTQAGELLLTSPGQAPQSLGRGHPIGVIDGSIYWFSTTSIRRRPLVGGATENVVWSPNTPELVSTLEHDGSVFLTWYGGTVGGGYVVFSANNLEPITLTLLDRVAARMGWRPWNFWESLGGQTLTSLLVALFATLALSPVMFVASLLIARFVPSERSTGVGIGIGFSTVLAVMAAVALLVLGPLSPSMPSPQALFGPPGELVLAFALGAGLSWLIRRKADSDVVFELVASAGISSLVTLAVLGFANFQTWSGLWEGVL